METKIKWNEGDGYITATYEGSGNDSASISSDVNEGIDREQSIKVETTDKSVSATLVVSQEGLREVFEPSDGLFVLADGGTYNVLKIGGEQPDTPVETYTRLTYIEATGNQYINTGYVMQEDDVIEMSYISTATTSADKALFGVVKSGVGIWSTVYSNSLYVRFGSSASVTMSSARLRYKLLLKKGSVVIDDINGSPVFSSMPDIPIYLFASNNNGNSVNMYGYCQSMGFKISKEDGSIVMDLRPCKRDSDGKIGMLDMVGGAFYSSEGQEEFVGGNEMLITEEYELADYVSFNNDIAFDTGYYGNNQTSIDVMFARTDTSGSDYLYGCSSGNRLTAYLPSSGTGYWRYGSVYKTLNTASKKIYLAKTTPKSIYVDNTGGSWSPTAFTTSFTLPIGGHKGSSGAITKTYQGLVYFFRMWHGEELIVDWFPCRRKSDGVEGFWDCVTQSFVEPI